MARAGRTPSTWSSRSRPAWSEAMTARTVITVPASAKRGEVIEVRTLIAHPMEAGYRTGAHARADGQVLPRDILRRFECRHDGELVFAADLAPAIAANPYIAFSLRA